MCFYVSWLNLLNYLFLTTTLESVLLTRWRKASAKYSRFITNLVNSLTLTCVFGNLFVINPVPTVLINKSYIVPSDSNSFILVDKLLSVHIVYLEIYSILKLSCHDSHYYSMRYVFELMYILWEVIWLHIINMLYYRSTPIPTFFILPSFSTSWPSPLSLWLPFVSRRPCGSRWRGGLQTDPEGCKASV